MTIRDCTRPLRTDRPARLLPPCCRKWLGGSAHARGGSSAPPSGSASRLRALAASGRRRLPPLNALALAGVALMAIVRVLMNEEWQPDPCAACAVRGYQCMLL